MDQMSIKTGSCSVWERCQTGLGCLRERFVIGKIAVEAEARSRRHHSQRDPSCVPDVETKVAQMSKWKQLLLVMCVFFMTTTHAQNKPLACQGDESAGLYWEDGRWKVTLFTTEKFILVLKGSNLDKDSLAKVFGVNERLKCETVWEGKIACSSEYGTYLFFSPSTMKGAYSQQYGGTADDKKYRDSLSIHAFTCQPF